MHRAAMKTEPCCHHHASTNSISYRCRTCLRIRENHRINSAASASWAHQNCRDDPVKEEENL